MNRFVTYALVLLACAAYGNANPVYGANQGYAPAVQQVALSSLPNLESYLNGASSYAPAPAAGYAPTPSYAPAPAYAPSTAVVLPASPSYASASSQNSAASAPAAPAYSGAAAPAYNAAAAPAYGANAVAPASGYNAAPSYAIQPAYASQLYPGQQNYKTFAAPAEYSRVSLPIIPSRIPVAKLYVPQNSYGSSAPY